MKTIKLSQSHILISGKYIPLKYYDKIEVDSVFFQKILYDYKTDLDTYCSREIYEEIITISILENQKNDTVELIARIKNGRLLWHSQPIKNNQSKFVFVMTAEMVLVFASTMYLIAYLLMRA